jgi:hypothetical protein
MADETHASVASRVMLRETGSPFSSDDLQLVRNDVVWIRLSDGTKEHVSVFAASAPYSFITSHLPTVHKIETSTPRWLHRIWTLI